MGPGTPPTHPHTTCPTILHLEEALLLKHDRLASDPGGVRTRLSCVTAKQAGTRVKTRLRVTEERSSSQPRRSPHFRGGLTTSSDPETWLNTRDVGRTSVLPITWF